MQVLRSSGFTGIPLRLTLDTATPCPQNVEQLRQLIEAADFFALSSPRSTSAPADRFRYQITIQDGDRHHTVSVGEAAVPDTLRPLLNWLVDIARQQ